MHLLGGTGNPGLVGRIETEEGGAGGRGNLVVLVYGIEQARHQTQAEACGLRPGVDLRGAVESTFESGLWADFAADCVECHDDRTKTGPTGKIPPDKKAFSLLSTAEAVADYLEPRMLETRTVADQADAWAILCESLADHSYAGLVETEQHRLAVAKMHGRFWWAILNNCNLVHSRGGLSSEKRD